jgi:hypothetical protein
MLGLPSPGRLYAQLNDQCQSIRCHIVEHRWLGCEPDQAIATKQKSATCTPIATTSVQRSAISNREL